MCMNYHDVFIRSSINACEIGILEKYMFFHLPQVSTMVTKESLETNLSTNSEKDDKMEKREIITQKDALFWIMYIHVYSKDEYDQLTKYTNVQMEEKRKYADFFSKQPNVMKNVNMKITKNNIKEHISDFMTNSDITIDSLHVLAVFYKRKIIICNDIVYYIIEPDDYEDSYDPIVIYKKDKQYYYIMNPDLVNIQSRFLLDKHSMPLKAISSYKVDDLRNISQKLGLNPEKNDKQSHYIEITKRCIL